MNLQSSVLIIFKHLIHLSLFEKSLEYLISDFFNLLCQLSLINSYYWCITEVVKNMQLQSNIALTLRAHFELNMTARQLAINFAV